MVKILAFAGSARKNSFNQQLVTIAASGAKAAGAEVTVLDMADFDMPIYNADNEASEGMPEKARAFKQLLIEHDGFLIASPEYNSAFSPLLKNVLDWASRAEAAGEPPLVAYKGKFAAIMATSPGAIGGLRGLVFLRMLLANIGVTVLPNQRAVPFALQAFNTDGTLIVEADQCAVLALGAELANTLARLKA
ncbi:MAG: NAD(P)H-dependent oxidoreductase [Methylococcaceae bacterium]